MPKFIDTFCIYNRAPRLPALVNALRQQTCPLPFEILAVNNNSQGYTLAMLKHLAREQMFNGGVARWIPDQVRSEGVFEPDKSPNHADHHCLSF